MKKISLVMCRLKILMKKVRLPDSAALVISRYRRTGAAI
jgi:hypothetical protein